MSEAAPDPTRRGNPALFIVLVVLTVIASGVLMAGFWGDEEEGNDLTRLQEDVSELDVGPGAPIPD